MYLIDLINGSSGIYEWFSLGLNRIIQEIKNQTRWIYWKEISPKEM